MANKEKIIAQIEIDVSNAEQSLKRLKETSKDGLLGKKGAKETNAEIQILTQRLAQLKSKLPGISSGEKEFKQFYSAVGKTTSEIEKCISKMTGFDITDDYIKKNVKEVQNYVSELKNASSALKTLQSGVKNQKLHTYQAPGEKRKSQTAESIMRQAAHSGNTELVKQTGKERKVEIKSRMSELSQDSLLYKQLQQDLATITDVQKQFVIQSLQISEALLAEGTAADKLSKALAGPRAEMEATQQSLQSDLDDVIKSLKNAANGADEMGQSFDQIKQSGKTIGELGDRLASLLSVTSIFYAIRRVVKDVVADFKELDKQFNEIAIVSDKSTSEMWEQFSSVNEIAQKFGVTTSNVLEVQNLYYHQGKDVAEVTKLTAQTLTLAKITGMDYARATSDLTAALNAYNLKAEEAVRVTDTIAAMDTSAAISSEELMTALTKTASIAANAGMSLENTEIFLTKMIETTREAPENLGTALKTIIARFGEVKQEVDGEFVELADINRVDTALKTVGVTLLDTTGQIRDLDDVFLELSSKWDSLDRNTQRYIATIAAGSRQQSRFIALMENYDRTLELTDAMQNSSGIGARQLAKSMESIETAMNTLKSSWQEFTQKFLKNKMFTTVLNAANKLLDVLNEIPAPILAIVGVVGAWALKTKVLDKALIAHKITQDGLLKGENAQVIASRIRTAWQTKEQSILLKTFRIMKELNKVKKASLKIDNKPKKLAKIGKGLDKELVEELLKLDQQEDAIKDVNDAKNSEILTTIEQTATMNQLTAEYDNATAALLRYEYALYKFKNKNKGSVLSFEDFVTAFDVSEGKGKKNINIDFSGLFSKKNKKKGDNKAPKVDGGEGANAGESASGLAGLFTKGGGGLSKAGVIGAIVAVVLAAVAVSSIIAWKYTEGSKDDSKSIEALSSAQEKYNQSLQKYKTLQSKVSRLKEIEKSQYKTIEMREEEQALIQEIVQEYPILLDHIDEEGNYHLKNGLAIQEEINYQKKKWENDKNAFTVQKLISAERGVYSDESTTQGRTIFELQNYFASMSETDIAALAGKVNSIEDKFSEAEFKKQANAYASGEKSSFSYKDFNNIMPGFSMTDDEFRKLSERYQSLLNSGSSEKEAMHEALKTLKEEGEIYLWDSNISKIANAWDQLNQVTGNLYSDLLKNAELEIKEIYLQEAEIYVEEELSKYTDNDKLKEALAMFYASQKKRIADIASSDESYVPSYVINHTSAIVDPFEAAFDENLSDLDRALNLLEGLKNSVSALGIGAKYLFSIFSSEDTRSADAYQYASDWMETSGAEDRLENIMKNDIARGMLEDTIEAYENGLANTEYSVKDDEYGKRLEIWNEDHSEYGAVYRDINAILGPYLVKQQESTQAFWAQLSDDMKIFLSEYMESAQITRYEFEYVKDMYNKLGKEAGESVVTVLNEIEKMRTEGEFSDEEAKKLRNEALGLNHSNLDDVVKQLTRMKELTGESSTFFSSYEKELLDIADAAGAIFFGDVIEEAEKLISRFDQMSESFEKFIGLAQGEGDLSALSSYLNLLSETAKDYDDFNKQVDTIIDNGSLTLEGIKIGKSDEAAQLMATQQKEYLMYQMRLLQGKLNDATEESEQKRLLADLALYRFAYGEVDAEYERTKREKYIEELEEEAEQLKKNRDLLKDYVNWLREYDRYANLDRAIESLAQEKKHLNFEVNFSTNTEVVKKDLQEELDNINSQIAANQGGVAAAKEEERMWKDVLQKQNSEYVSFGKNGEAIVNAQKMQELQKEIAGAEDEQREILQNEYDEIMANVEAYNKAQDKVDNYTDALEKNFEELQNFLNGLYQNVKTVEDKLIELRIEAEDKELEKVKEKYDRIQEENDKYLNSVKRMVEKERQIRDQKQNQEDVEKKEKKLAMMKMDTSGIYAKDIQELEAELQQDYQKLEDDAVDLALQQMEEDFEEEAEKYQKDIEFMEDSLEYKREKMTEYNTWATQLIEQGSDAVLAYLKANDEEYYTGSAAAQALWESEWNGAVTRAVTSNETLKESLTQSIINTLNSCKDSATGFEGAVTQYSKTAVVENGKVKDSVSTLTGKYTLLATGVSGVVTQINNLRDAYSQAAEAASKLNKQQGTEIIGQSYQGDIDPLKTEGGGGGGEETYTANTFIGDIKTLKKGEVKKVSDVLDTFGFHADKINPTRVVQIGDSESSFLVYVPDVDAWVAAGSGIDTDGDPNFIYSSTRRAVPDSVWQSAAKGGDLPTDLKLSDKARLFSIEDTFLKAMGAKKFATGGFAYETGPAWLDGTPTKPEAVLNALQTKHFIQFTNVLDTLFSGHSNLTSNPHQTQKSGDTNYTFHIKVDQMASDYDVDRLVERIEEKMVKASRYRNVTTLTKITSGM